MPCLVVEGAGGTRSIDLTGDHVTIGRQADNLVALPDDVMVSRHHATLEFRDGHWWIHDLGSHNGTTVDGRAVEGWRPLVEGSRIQIGSTKLVLVDIAFDARATATRPRAAGESNVTDDLRAGTSYGSYTSYSSMRTFLFTDLERHTEMLQLLGDVAGRAALREHERSAQLAFGHHGGVAIKGTGDGFLASFGSAQRALACAAELQRACAEHDVDGWGELKVRIGINAGEPIAEDGDLFGSSVNLAARITALATGGQVLVSNVVKELVAGKPFRFRDRGETTLRGFDHPTRVWELDYDTTLPP